VFGRKKEEESDPTEQTAAPATKLPRGYTPAKGAPTPRRKDVEARNRRPIVSDRSRMTKQERKAFDKEERAKSRAESNARWEREQRAMKTGDERFMPPQHAGPVRRFGRDCIDARFSPAVIFMPLALILLVAMFTQTLIGNVAFQYLVLAIYAIFILVAIYSVLMVRRVRLLTEHKFGDDKVPPRFFWQMFTRTFYPRRWRLPRPQVKRGQFPEGGSGADVREARSARRGRK
jgi:hypothetical protein